MGVILKFREPVPTTTWTTTDGRTFSSREDADQHQAILDFEGWYNDNCLKNVKAGECLVWLRNNVDFLNNVLQAFLKARRI